jgi:hypothetical protein
VPGFEGLGVVGEEGGAIAGFDVEDEVAAVDTGFDEGEFEGIEGNAFFGVVVLVVEDGGFAEGAVVGGEVAVGIDPGFAGGAGDVGIALLGGRADAGPEAGGDGVGDEFRAEDLIGLEEGEERVVSGLAVGPAEKKRDGHAHILDGGDAFCEATARVGVRCRDHF